MNETRIRIADTIANPAPLGLMGFGMTTVLLNIHNAGFAPLHTAIIAMGICYGGIAQVVAGIMEFKKNNTFGATAFTSYGFFWLSLVGIWWLPKAGFSAPDGASMGWYLSLWGIFTLYMYIATLKQTRANQFVFLSLTILFFLLAAGDFSGNKAVTVVAGYEGIVCGLSAIYAAMAQTLNEVYGRKVLPL